MNKQEIFAMQDKQVGYLLDLLKIQKASGYLVSVRNPDLGETVTVEAVLRSLIKMTLREDLKDKIQAGLNS